jgi:hypothetical protein
MELLRPAPDDLLVATPVSSRANSVKNDDPECLSPSNQEMQKAHQLALVPNQLSEEQSAS